MLCLYVQAPFAVFRTFTTGSFRPTADFITPSAAYGLLLNLAGIEMRAIDPKQVMTVIQSDLPKVRMALGAVPDEKVDAVIFPLHHTIYQQLHNYPIGASGKDHAVNTKGNKYNITPVRRSFLSDIKAYICIDGNSDLEGKVISGLQGDIIHDYGLPFLGDNNFLLDKIELVENRKTGLLV
ncbi:MAG: CRISPR-associated protein Cas5 [bacterium]